MDETVSTLNYAQQANGILNRQQQSSVRMASALPQQTVDALNAQQKEQRFGGSGSGSGGGVGGGGGTGISMSDWNELELKLLYMEAQVEEAQGALGRKHAAMVEALDAREHLEKTVATLSRSGAGAADALLRSAEAREDFLSEVGS